MDHSSGLVFRRPQATLTADLWSIFAPPFSGPTLVPLDLDAGLVERTTPALGFRIALGYAKDHMRSCAEDMTADHRCPPSRSTLERVAKTIGTAATRVAPRIEPRLRRAERVPDGAVAISLGLDRTSVPMEEDVPAGETPATRRKTRQTPYTRTKPAPVNVNDRMAYVGTISFHDADGTALATRRYTAAAHESPTDRLVRPMMADLRHALRQVPALAVGVIQDGAPELWNLLRPALLAEPLVTACYEATDRYHLTERLADVLRYGEPEPEPGAGPPAARATAPGVGSGGRRGDEARAAVAARRRRSMMRGRRQPPPGRPRRLAAALRPGLGR